MRPIDGKRPFPEMLGKGLSFEVLHDEKVDAVLVSDVVEGADVRMLERGDGPRFALEPLTEIGVGGERRGQDFDGDEAIEPDVARLVDLAHAAGPQRAQDFIRTEANTGSQTHGWCIMPIGGIAVNIVPMPSRRPAACRRTRGSPAGTLEPDFPVDGQAHGARQPRRLTSFGRPSRLQTSPPTFGRRVAEHPCLIYASRRRKRK